jgi:hypothetical protein
VTGLVGSWRYARTAVIEPMNGNGFWRITIEQFHVLSLGGRSKGRMTDCVRVLGNL